MANRSTSTPVTSTTPIAIKVLFEGSNRRLKLPMGDLAPARLPGKLRTALNIPADIPVVFERYSDSSQSYIRLDSNYPTAYKSLLRAAKAKLKLRLRATMPNEAVNSADGSSRSTGSATDLLTGSSTADSATASSSSSTDPIPTANPSEITLIEQFNTILSGLGSVPSPAESAKPAEPAQLGDLVGEGQAPVPQPFSADLGKSGKEDLEKYTVDADFLKEVTPNRPERVEECKWAQACNWTVYCNWCDKAMAGEHYHCSTCDGGDYDLCNACVDAGVHCPGEDHWLIKRILKNGIPLNSTTERVAPAAAPKPKASIRPTKPEEKPKAEVQKAPEVKGKAAVKPISEKVPEQTMPGAYQEDKKESPFAVQYPRTCNSCVRMFSEDNFVHCTTCEDFDLCFPCLRGGKHGHHPAHGFVNASPKTTVKISDKILCRNATHSALCDGCDQYIHGVRHKCLNCPDWDYCDNCIKSSKEIHPGHRFVPIYDPLPEPRTIPVSHYGILCDGPLCNDKPGQNYIRGIRYKCAICHDTDFCANCEASPVNKHNRTHPLIMLKTPVQNVSVTTMGENRDGSSTTMGDSRPRAPSPAQSEVSKVVTIADVKPTEAPVSPRSPPKEKIEIKDLLTEPIKEKIKIQDLLSATPAGPSAPIAIPAPLVPATKPALVPAASPSPAPGTATQYGELNAHFLQDLITDGTKVVSGRRFLQVWTILNPGPTRWPAGTRVRYVGGDHMLAMENEGPFSVQNHEQTAESNATIAPVEIGQKFAFRVEMKAPKRKGAAISYWRLKAPDGTPFGHRLWCHIHVVEEAAEPKSIAEHPAPQLYKCASIPMRLGDRFYPSGYTPEFHGQVPPPPPPPPMRNPGTFVPAPAPFGPHLSNEQYKMLLQYQQQRILARNEEMARAGYQSTPASYFAGRTPPVPEKTPLTGTASPPPPPPPQGPPTAGVSRALDDYQMQLARMNAANRERLRLHRLSASQVPMVPSPIHNPPGSSAKGGNAGVHMIIPEASRTSPPPPPPRPVEAPASAKGKEAMIFPVLQKDGSPSSSVHAETDVAIPVTPAAAAVVPSASPSVASPNPRAARVDDEEEELFDDAESLTAELVDGDESDASGFLTDEEYDILDASDEEGL